MSEMLKPESRAYIERYIRDDDAGGTYLAELLGECLATIDSLAARLAEAEHAVAYAPENAWHQLTKDGIEFYEPRDGPHAEPLLTNVPTSA